MSAPEFSFVVLSGSRQVPRPTVRGLCAGGSELPGRSPYGWLVPNSVDGRLAPPESAMLLMEKGAGHDPQRLVSLAAEFRAAIAAGHRQCDDAESEAQVMRCVGHMFESAMEGGA
jgi:hypothetical protein